MTSGSERIGVVVIGRNEGQRLVRCLDSLIAQGAPRIVYVDSGSSDGSLEMATARGVLTVSLNSDIPFTMARGRNAGFARLTELEEPPELVQFVDGDCEVDPHWLDRGATFLEHHLEVVAVCGFRRERFPEASIYNRVVDIEWRGNAGRIDACGGDAMYRTEALRIIGGFNDTMIAGEEAELCARLRARGGVIWRLDAPMTLHDAAIHRFNQWWQRSVRSGHAYAEGYTLSRDPNKLRQGASALLYGFLLPTALTTLAFSPGFRGVAVLGGLGAYARCANSAFRARRRLDDSREDALLYAAFCVLAKFPEARGVMRFWLHQLLGKRSSLIEYKESAQANSSTSRKKAA